MSIRYQWFVHISRGVDHGSTNTTFLDLILRNVPEPELLRGDLKSQLAACHAVGIGLQGLADKYGRDEFDLLVDELLDYSETLVRSQLDRAPNGHYTERELRATMRRACASTGASTIWPRKVKTPRLCETASSTAVAQPISSAVGA